MVKSVRSRNKPKVATFDNSEAEWWDAGGDGGASQPVVPERTRLYNLAPIGVGTPLVESLPSYITRLAEAHSVTLYSLLVREVVPTYAPDADQKRLAIEAFQIQARWEGGHLNGIGSVHQTQVLAALGQLTGRTDLHCTTMVGWNSTITSRGLIRLTKAWCPDCYSEWQHSELPLYDPLIWSLRDIKLCPRHKAPLIDQCPHCAGPVPFLSSRAFPGRCRDCKSQLFDPNHLEQNKANGKVGPGHDLDYLFQEWDVWCGKVVGEMLAYSNNRTTTLPLAPIANLIEEAVRQVMGSRSKFVRATGIPTPAVIEWLDRGTLPRLSWYLYVCHCLGISLAETTHLPVQLRTSGYEVARRATPAYQPDLSLIPVNLVAVRAELERLLHDDLEEIPTLEDIARSLECSKETIRRNFRELQGAIAERRRSLALQRKRAEIERMKGAVVAEVTRLSELGEYPGYTKITKVLPNPSLIRITEVRQAYKEAIQALNAEREWLWRRR